MMCCQYKRYFFGWTLHHDPNLEIIKVETQGNKLKELFDNARLHTVDKRHLLGPVLKFDQVHLIDYMILKGHFIDFLNYELFGAKVSKDEYDNL